MKFKAFICIITQSHLCRNPRVLKEAIALAEADYKVIIVTSSISTELLRQDMNLIGHHPSISISIVSDLSGTGSFKDKLIFKLGRSLNKYFRIETPFSLGYGLNRYYKRCKEMNANLYICHQELGMYIGTKLIEDGYKVIFDFEDWYTEDLLPAARKERPVNLLRKTERTALKKGVLCLTTSEALAVKLAETYACPKPTVIYNVFPKRADLHNQDKQFSMPLKIFWFSQTIGPGRGLEQFIVLSDSFKSHIELHLLGNVAPGYKDKLKTLLPAQHQLLFHNIVVQQELAQKIAQFDIGLALELDTPQSRNYTITNKFFQYIQAGLPLITSETNGQNEVFDLYNPGFKISQNPSTDELTKLNDWLNDPSALQNARLKALKAAVTYNWENESSKLIASITKIFE